MAQQEKIKKTTASASPNIPISILANVQ